MTPPSASYHVFIKKLTGECYRIECHPFDEVEDVKAMIHAQHGIPRSRQRLIYAGKQLEGNRTLADYCVQTQSTLHLVLQEADREAAPAPAAAPFEPMHPQLRGFDEEFLHPVVRRGPRGGEHPAEELLEGVFALPLLSAPFCAALREEVCHYMAHTGDSGVALRLSWLGLSRTIQTIVRAHAAPLIASLLPELRGLEEAHRFVLLPKIMSYSQRTNADWPAHTDGDVATINVCLADGFEGAKLRVFQSEREGRPHVDLEHKSVGTAIIHRGDVIHSVTPLTSGERCTLIIKVSKPIMRLARRARTPPPNSEPANRWRLIGGEVVAAPADG